MKPPKQGDRVYTGTGSGTIDGFVVDDDGELTALVVLADEDTWCSGATAWISADALHAVEVH